MAKLQVTFPEKCIGCELCILLAQRLSQGSIGTNESPIRISGEKGKFNIEIDEGRLSGDKEIVEICPTNVFTLKNEDK